MSKHRIKAVAVDDDDYGDHDEDGEGEELTAEDKEQLRLGTIQVRETLGQNVPATDKEIQEALWHYYYDVPKSVTYLKNKQNPVAKGRKQTPGKPPGQ